MQRSGETCRWRWTWTSMGVCSASRCSVPPRCCRRTCSGSSGSTGASSACPAQSLDLDADSPRLESPGGELVIGRVAHRLEREPTGRQDLDGRLASASREQPGHPLGGRRPSPTATRPPTSERTIEWQNASASMSTSTRSSAGRRHRRLSTRRIVVAPSPRLAERGEVVLADQRRGRGVHRGHVQPPPVNQRRRAGAGRPRPGRRRSGTRSGGPARRTARRSPPVPPRRGARGSRAAADRRAAARARRPAWSGRARAAPPTRAAGTSTWQTWPRACTPASVRPATVVDGGSGRPQQRVASAASSSPWTVRWPGWLAQPANVGAVVRRDRAAHGRARRPQWGRRARSSTRGRVRPRSDRSGLVLSSARVSGDRVEPGRLSRLGRGEPDLGDRRVVVRALRRVVLPGVRVALDREAVGLRCRPRARRASPRRTGRRRSGPR